MVFRLTCKNLSIRKDVNRIQAILEKIMIFLRVIAIVIFHLTLQEFQSVSTHTIESATAHIRQCHNDIKLFIRYLVLIKRYLSVIFEKNIRIPYL